MRKLIVWIRDGNDCDKCKALWSDWSDYLGDGDYGCCIKGSDFEDSRCRLPKLIIAVLMRKHNYFVNHEYDGCAEWYDKYCKQEDVNREKVEKLLKPYCLCWKDKDGNLYEYNKSEMLSELSYHIARAFEPEYITPPKLGAKWKSIVKETLMYIPNKVKPYVCK